MNMTFRLCSFILFAAFIVPSYADKPDWAGGGKHGKKQEQRGSASAPHFGDQHRRIIAEYYGGQSHPGKKCPPGLAKKNNGCMPPGQAKKWGMGRTLPGDLRYYDLPRDLLMRLDLLPIFSTSLKLVKSAFEGRSGHEEAVHGRADHRVPQAG
ncbi:MAG: hypothetical protein KF853_06880 [Rhodocyclaceae bacterium]|nr:hypothetical protein [Rhodocyclaceae bacterium]